MDQQTEMATQNWHFETYRENPDIIRDYLNNPLEEGSGSFLLALKDVIASCGGIGVFSQKTGIELHLLHEIVFTGGNPSLKSISLVLKAFNLRISLVRE